MIPGRGEGFLAGGARGLLDLLFVPSCAACDEPLRSSEEVFCRGCREKVRPIEPPHCTRCGIPFEGRTGPSHVCGACRRAPPPFASLRSYGRYEGAIEEAVQGLKYRERLWVLPGLVRLLAEAAARGGGDPDLVLPVPLHPRRLALRGFNQAALLARALGRRIGVPTDLGSLARGRDTPSQTGLDRKERLRNVAGAFVVVRPWEVWRRRILLVDDVATTGATLGGCARALRKAGARSIDCVTVARAV